MGEEYKPGDRVSICVSELEFVVGGTTIWVHSPKGATVLRIRTPLGSVIKVNNTCENIVSHSDIMAADPIEFCLKEG